MTLDDLELPQAGRRIGSRAVML